MQRSRTTAHFSVTQRSRFCGRPAKVRVKCGVTIRRRFNISVLTYVAVLVCFTAPDRAGSQSVSRREPPPLRAATLDQVLMFALRQNPDLLIAGTTVDSARAEQRIAGALPNPSYVASPNTPYQYGASISLDVGPQRYFRTRASGLGVGATRLDQRDALRQLTLNVQRAFVDVLLSDTLEYLVRARYDVVRQVLASDSARFAAGDIPERNLFRTEGVLAHAQADLARAHVAVQTARLALQGLMGVANPDTGFTVVGDLHYTRGNPVATLGDSALLALALAHRPDLAAAAQRVLQSDVQRRLAASALIPIPQLSYVRQFTVPFDGGHFYSFGLGVEVPILNFYSGQRARAAAGARAAEYAHDRASSQVTRDVVAAITAFRTQRALVERFESDLLSKSDADVDATRYAYSHGAASLLDVLDSVKQQQDLRTDYFGALRDYWVSTFALSAAVGMETISSVGA